jgi:hypothetical protein
MAAKDVCDIDRLKRSNDLQWKWFCRTELPRNDYVKWCFRTCKDPQAHKKTLPINMRSAFAKDIPYMFYAKEIEHDLIVEYDSMVHYVLRKKRFPEDSYDDLYSVGLNVIRYAAWSFRSLKNKCGFTTFAHNSLDMRFKSEYTKKKSKLERHAKNRFMINNYSDLGAEDLNLNDILGKTDPMANLQEEEAMQRLQSTIVSANLNQEEKDLLNALVNRFERNRDEKIVWYKEFAEKNKSNFPNGSITKEGLRQKVLRLQRKLWHHWHASANESVPEMPHTRMRE